VSAAALEAPPNALRHFEQWHLKTFDLNSLTSNRTAPHKHPPLIIGLPPFLQFLMPPARSGYHLP
jgi:hypothetical protein